MRYDIKILEQKFNSLPDDLKDAISSTDTGKIVQMIGESHGLMLDQISDLNEEVGYVMLGLTPTKSFTKTISKRLEIDEQKATDITKDINIKIFDKIKESIRKMEEEFEANEENTEQSPIQPPTSPASQTISAIEKAGDFTVEKEQAPQSSSPQYNDSNLNREQVLKDIEDKPVPLVDHLLTTPMKNPEKVEVKQPYSADPYREQI